MIRANSRISINSRRIRQLTQGAVTALEKTAEALHMEVVQAQVVPRDTGHLQGEAFFVDYTEAKDGKATLVNSTPYARRLYYHPEYQYQKDENPNAKGKWYEDWMVGGKHEDFCEKAFKELYRREGGLS